MCVNMSLLYFLSLTTLPRKMVIEDGKFMIEGHYVPEETSIQKYFQTIGNKFSHSMNIMLLTSRYHTFKVKHLQINLKIVIPLYQHSHRGNICSCSKQFRHQSFTLRAVKTQNFKENLFSPLKVYCSGFLYSKCPLIPCWAFLLP